MRGAQGIVNITFVPYGIIPADAGSTILHYFSLPINKDHPRGCGEHRAWRFPTFDTLGSSPRMRGAHIPCGVAESWGRIIPADAGSTACFSSCFLS